MEGSRFLACLVLAVLLFQANPLQIPLEEIEDKVFLNCQSNITWLEGTTGTPLSNNKSLDLGKRILDPRGVYSCNWTYKDIGISSLQVYYRMCQNCVELDSATLAGIVITDIIATVLLALGVYCFAGHETGRLSMAAADTQDLLRNNQLYQPLRDRSDAQYSRLGENWARNKQS